MTNASQTDPLLGRLIDGRYQVRSRIARGGMATVYLATDLRLERRVALKVMHSHLADDTNFKTRFVQEARSTARLAHPNVVNVFDQGQDDDMAYLVMEYLPGITLRDLLRDYGKLTPEQTIDIMEAVLSGLAAAHRAGIVHRDLKPENVLLADDGRIKLGDFGLARAATKATGTGQALLGTIAYLSPELVTRGIADTRSDIYAIGIMMYEMLTGEQPFQGEQPMQIAYQHANDAVPRPSLKNPLVPAQLDDLVLWATARDPEARPADARALLDRLLEAEVAVRGGRPAEEGMDATLVLSPGPVGPDTAAQTALLAQQPAFSGPAAQVRAEASVTDAVTRLAKVSRRRRGRGWWLFALVLLLAGAAGGTGWYFGTGPGALVTVPNVTGKPEASAAKTLRDASFTVVQKKVYSLSVGKGLVVGSTPNAKAQAHKGSTVTIDVSQGAKPNTVPALAGLTQDEAQKAITAVGDQVGTSIDSQFNSKVPADTVISATRASDGTSLAKGGAYFEGQVVNLVVSLGPLPKLDGLDASQAKEALQSIGLVPGEGTKRYSSSVPKDDVISHSPAKSGPIHKGDTILLDISLGPKLYPVPDVTGDTLDVALVQLANEGFKADYPDSVGIFPVKGYESGYTVTSESPDATTQQPKGTTIKLTLKFSNF